MVRLASIVFISVLVASAAFAQNPPDRSGMAPKTEQQQKMSAMHDQMMKSMQADLDSMRSNLQKMKEQLSKVSDQPTKDQLQLNITMWQSLVDNMDKHLSMMKQMMGAGHGMVMPGHQPPEQKK